MSEDMIANADLVAREAEREPPRDYDDAAQPTREEIAWYVWAGTRSWVGPLEYSGARFGHRQGYAAGRAAVEADGARRHDEGYIAGIVYGKQQARAAAEAEYQRGSQPAGPEYCEACGMPAQQVLVIGSARYPRCDEHAITEQDLPPRGVSTGA